MPKEIEVKNEISGIADIPTILNEHKTNGMTEQEEEMLLNEEKYKNLTDIITAYYCSKSRMEDEKQSIDKLNIKIKDLMQEMNIEDFETDTGLKAKITVQNRDTLNEPKMIERLKELGLTSAIKTKEYIDIDEVENLIYQGNLNAKELEDCTIKKQVVALTVKEGKK